MATASNSKQNKLQDLAYNGSKKLRKQRLANKDSSSFTAASSLAAVAEGVPFEEAIKTDNKRANPTVSNLAPCPYQNPETCEPESQNESQKESQKESVTAVPSSGKTDLDQTLDDTCPSDETSHSDYALNASNFNTDSQDPNSSFNPNSNHDYLRMFDPLSPEEPPYNHNDPRYLEQRKHGSRIFPIDCHHWKTENGPCYSCWHWHPEVEIIHMVEGKGFELEFADRHFVMDAPAIFVIPSCVLHRINFDRTSEVYGILGKANHTLFDPSILEMARFDEALNNTLAALETGMLSLSTPILSTDLGFAELDKVMTFVDDYAKHKDAGMRLQVKGCLLQFLGILHHFGYLNNHHMARSNRNNCNNNEERIKELFAYIRNNYNRPLSIMDVASRLNVSRQYFCRLFKSLTNMSFVEYLNVVRLNCAAQDILQSNDPLNEIAERHGFDSISYFFKVFKQQFNCTPNTFRRNKGQVDDCHHSKRSKTQTKAQCCPTLVGSNTLPEADSQPDQKSSPAKETKEAKAATKAKSSSSSSSSKAAPAKTQAKAQAKAKN